MHRRLSLSALCLIAIVPLLAQAPAPAPGLDSIRQADLRADLFFLAGDAMRGRLTDTVENVAAADYIRSRYERAGLAPAAAGGSYFQNYLLMTATLGDGNALEVAGADGATRRLAQGPEFYPQRFSASGTVSGAIAFAGFGITAARLNHDDYAGDVAGKIVVVLDHEPGERDPKSPFDGVVTAEPAVPWRKALAAQEHGAAAILFVADVHNHPEPVNLEQTSRAVWPATPPHLKTYTLAAWADRLRIPAAQISPGVAAALLAGTGKSLVDLAAAAESSKGALAVPGARVTLTTSVVRHTIPDRNVVGVVAGSDPKLKDEWVLVTAHFDHDGAEGPRIFNGADDNGSGTVALLEIADAYAEAARQGQRPKRSVMFAAWNSEERGLLGAWAFTEAPLAPLPNIVAVLNMDMIGRNEEVEPGGGPRFNGLEVQTPESNANALNVMGFSRAPGVAAAMDAANRGIDLNLLKRYDNNASNLVRRSDQWPFLQRGVPALGFMTGLHPDYHTVYDRPEKINYPKMEKIARLVHQASWDLANAPSRPAGPAATVR